MISPRPLAVSGTSISHSASASNATTSMDSSSTHPVEGGVLIETSPNPCRLLACIAEMRNSGCFAAAGPLTGVRMLKIA
jgi:hypothetical protein